MAVVTVHKSTPGADFAALVTAYNAAVTLINELRTDHNALCAKLDLDAGVTDTTYNSLTGIAAAAADTITLTV